MILPASVLDAIRRRLEAAYPDEACGPLLGVVDGEVRVVDQLGVANRRAADGAAARRYLIGPADVRDATRAAAARGLDVVGVYHSHPDVPPHPSPYDRELAWPSFEYLIVSVRVGRADEVRAWRLRDDRTGFDERPVMIAPPGRPAARSRRGSGRTGSPTG